MLAAHKLSVHADTLRVYRCIVLAVYVALPESVAHNNALLRIKSTGALTKHSLFMCRVFVCVCVGGVAGLP